MKHWPIYALIVILLAGFVASGIMEWRYAALIQDDVSYMSERMINAPNKLPWSRSDSSFPYGVHEELGLHSTIRSIFGAINQATAIILVSVLVVSLWRGSRCRKASSGNTGSPNAEQGGGGNAHEPLSHSSNAPTTTRATP